MRVLHVASGNLYGGIETLLVTLARERARCPHMEPHFAVCFPGRLADELGATGVPVHNLGETRVRRPLSIWRARRRLRALLRTERIDVVVSHAPWTHALFAPAVRALDRPLVLWLHAPFVGRHWLERWARRTHPDALICNSRFTAGASAGAFAGVPSEVIYAPVSIPPAESGVVERGAVRAELDTPAEATVIVQIGRLDPWKGWRLHLEALGALRDVPGWVAWLVAAPHGASQRRTMLDLRQAATRLGIVARIRFVGERTDVARILSAADIFCQPNTEPEPFGLVVVEALLAGLPVVTTATGGIAEIVDDTCALTVATEPAAVAAGLRHLVADGVLRRQLGVSGPARARKLCHPATQMTQVARRLTALAGGHAGRPAAGAVDGWNVSTRARRSEGSSDAPICAMVDHALSMRAARTDVFVDVGCGTGALWRRIGARCRRWVGVDAVRYEGLPDRVEFCEADLDRDTVPLPDGTADVVAAVEVIEHLENPRRLVREMVRVARPGGWVVVTTPNQLSALSFITLLVKGRFSAFQDVHYPAHLTALLEVDLRRIATECGLTDVAIVYSQHGRLVLTPWHYPRWLARLFPGWMSDNVLLIGRKASG